MSSIIRSSKLFSNEPIHSLGELLKTDGSTFVCVILLHQMYPSSFICLVFLSLRVILREDVLELADVDLTILINIEEAESSLNVFICGNFLEVCCANKELMLVDHSITVQIKTSEKLLPFNFLATTLVNLGLGEVWLGFLELSNTDDTITILVNLFECWNKLVKIRFVSNKPNNERGNWLLEHWFLGKFLNISNQILTNGVSLFLLLILIWTSSILLDPIVLDESFSSHSFVNLPGQTLFDKVFGFVANTRKCFLFEVNWLFADILVKLLQVARITVEWRFSAQELIGHDS